MHNAVRRREAAIAARLLAAGANPNLAIYSSSSSSSSSSSGLVAVSGEGAGASSAAVPSPQSPSSASQHSEEEFYFKGSTCLVEACKNRDLAMIDLLLKYSARLVKSDEFQMGQLVSYSFSFSLSLSFFKG